MAALMPRKISRPCVPGYRSYVHAYARTHIYIHTSAPPILKYIFHGDAIIAAFTFSHRPLPVSLFRYSPNHVAAAAFVHLLNLYRKLLLNSILRSSSLSINIYIYIYFEFKKGEKKREEEEFFEPTNRSFGMDIPSFVEYDDWKV